MACHAQMTDFHCFFFFFQTFTVNGRLSTQSVVLFYGYILATEWA